MTRTWIILAVAAAIAAALVFCGYSYRGYQCQVAAQGKEIEDGKAREASVQRAIEQANDIARQDAEVSAGYEQSRIELRTVYKTIAKERITYVEKHADLRDCGLDADGLRLWNAANAGTLHADPGKPASATGRTTASAEREAPRFVGKPRRGDTDLPQLGRPLPAVEPGD